VKDIGGKFLLEKDGNRVCARAFIDPAGIGLVIVQDKELIAPDNQVATFDPIAFFAGKDGLEREAANVPVAACPIAARIEDDILFPELAEVGLFVKSRGGMVGQLRIIHGIQI